MKAAEYEIIRLNERDYIINDEDVHMYLLLGDERAMLVDTGFGTRDLPGAVRSITDLPLTVINSHGHFDHAAGDRLFPRAFAHKAEFEEIRSAIEGDFELCELKDGDKIDLGGRVFEVINMPGHRPGAIMLLERSERLIITGDNVVTTPVVMYMREHDFETLLASEKKLKALGDSFDKINPAHGVTPLGREQADCMIACIEAYLRGDTTGREAIGPEGTPCLLHEYGGAAVYTEK